MGGKEGEGREERGEEKGGYVGNDVFKPRVGLQGLAPC